MKDTDKYIEIAEARKLSRHETHDLGMIIKDRAKVLKLHAEAKAAERIADFERNLASNYKFDEDEIWKEATEAVRKVVAESQDKINARCKKLGIPARFAPSIQATWSGRGENALNQRRVELRRVAKSAVDSMLKNATTKIEQQSLDLRTQIVAMGLLSKEAKLFLESIAPVDEMLKALDIGDIEKRLDTEAQKQLRGPRYGGDYA